MLFCIMLANDQHEQREYGVQQSSQQKATHFLLPAHHPIRFSWQNTEKYWWLILHFDDFSCADLNLYLKLTWIC